MIFLSHIIDYQFWLSWNFTLKFSSRFIILGGQQLFQGDTLTSDQIIFQLHVYFTTYIKVITVDRYLKDSVELKCISEFRWRRWW